MKVEIKEVAGLYPAIMGMRNPLDSWDKSDSYITPMTGEVFICDKDLDLARRLINAGGEHRKFLRQIQVWVNITVPRYLWQELDTYKFGTKNSCSTMHTIGKRKLNIDDFYIGDDEIVMTREYMMNHTIPIMNKFQELYEDSKDYRWVKEMKRVCPESFLQMRTLNTNYEELRNIYHQRENHKLNEEWGVILEMIRQLPYSDFITK